MTISERIEAVRRERRVLTRVSRAAWRLEQAERERTWALVSARAEGISIRTLATAAGLSPSRVHQIVTDADLDALDAALGELGGWPSPLRGIRASRVTRAHQSRPRVQDRLRTAWRRRQTEECRAWDGWRLGRQEATARATPPLPAPRASIGHRSSEAGATARRPQWRVVSTRARRIIQRKNND